MARNRTRGADQRERQRKATRSGPAMPGLRWVPVPLAVLLALLGWLVFGSVAGQHALASAQAGPEQGGMGLKVNEVVWMANDMGNPGQKANPNQFQMPQSMMPGMQKAGEKRLRIELYLSDISNKPQVYGLVEFRLLGTGKQSWAPVDTTATRGSVIAATLYPGFQATDDLYFDLPISQRGKLRLEWEHGGHIMTIPVHATGMDSGLMVGM